MAKTDKLYKEFIDFYLPSATFRREKFRVQKLAYRGRSPLINDF